MTTINPATTLDVEGEIAVLTLDNPPVNALSHILREGVAAGLEAAAADPAVKAIVLICAGRTFIAGADIKEFGKPIAAPTLQDLQDQIEALDKPVIAALHGTALGGGLELALACHYRIASPSAKVGLPEIKLGIIPGAGGTQRLPRLVGLPRALDMILTGTPVGAASAVTLGVVDELAAGDLRAEALRFANAIVAEGRPLRRIRDEAQRLDGEDVDAALASARERHGRKMRGFESFEKAMEAVANAARLPFDEGLAREREIFVELLGGTQSKAQRYVFGATRAVAKIADIPADTPTRKIGRVGIIGAGTMGGGIAMNFLSAGIPVTIVEQAQAALDRGTGTIAKNYAASVRRGRIRAEDAEKANALLTPSLEFDDLADCDLIIEAAFEEMAVKKEIFTRLDAIARDGAILASNTSYLDIDEIASVTKRPADVLGMHFFSPANIMKLLEVVRGRETARDVIATAMKIGRDIGKTAVLVGVCHGFVGNRMLSARQREANKLILEGAMPWDVDRVLTDFGLPMGPFQMADLAGLDLGWNRETSKSETIRERLCEADRRGQKTSAGFYDYDENRKGSPSAMVEEIILTKSREEGFERRAIGDDEILERLVYPMINEGAKILEEGIAQRASDIDVVWINGYGWPVYRGGPMFTADTIGPDVILDKMREFEARFGEDFTPAPMLERIVREGGSFTGAA
ncbi:3-hydroxyacyl-CoA dehydrogenase NAD-binding domain-containing protein [Aurantimonas coralicida]|uniref:3-hydroxyacyl-CoA dehydrogenase NAD-binding domain-containing protein n=1 Tax=Aurantimonas coralicida TaxID=182270 RepID=UPI0023A095FE|nr:3-hydroxyacyl-CoA dehydrogenase NAD-binding domain-containing protein [Aurantimonas coralicida]MDE0921440.1 3-hydroxyacyl-CoA dehydrogenase NAD-binding domain-containing protein [Aurantimonas coralicida]